MEKSVWLIGFYNSDFDPYFDPYCEREVYGVYSSKESARREIINRLKEYVSEEEDIDIKMLDEAWEEENIEEIGGIYSEIAVHYSNEYDFGWYEEYIVHN